MMARTCIGNVIFLERVEIAPAADQAPLGAGSSQRWVIAFCLLFWTAVFWWLA